MVLVRMRMRSDHLSQEKPFFTLVLKQRCLPRLASSTNAVGTRNQISAWNPPTEPLSPICQTEPLVVQLPLWGPELHCSWYLLVCTRIECDSPVWHVYLFCSRKSHLKGGTNNNRLPPLPIRVAFLVQRNYLGLCFATTTPCFANRNRYSTLLNLWRWNPIWRAFSPPCMELCQWVGMKLKCEGWLIQHRRGHITADFIWRMFRRSPISAVSESTSYLASKFVARTLRDTW